jgi:hypothetical protein
MGGCVLNRLLQNWILLTCYAKSNLYLLISFPTPPIVALNVAITTLINMYSKMRVQFVFQQTHYFLHLARSVLILVVPWTCKFWYFVQTARTLLRLSLLLLNLYLPAPSWVKWVRTLSSWFADKKFRPSLVLFNVKLPFILNNGIPPATLWVTGSLSVGNHIL